MKAAGTLKRELGEAVREQREQRVRAERADARVSKLLAEARDHPDVTMIEAARLAGLGRANAYKMANRAGERR